MLRNTVFGRFFFAMTIAAGLSSFAANSFAAEAFSGRILTAVTAGADHDSVAVDSSAALYGSFQVIWASLTGTVNGVAKVQVSNDGGTSWDDLSGATLTVSGASGHNTISIAGVLTESLVRVDYAHTGVTGGTISCYATLKQ